MEQTQVQKLKINATNIRNTLTGYNKQLRKLRVEESRYSFISEKRRKIEAEEKRLEKGPIQKSTEWLKSRIVSAPMSFLDKLKEFFGIVLLGLIINNLPKIIAQLKQFFSDNKWLIDVVKFTISAIADGVMGMIWLVTKYPKAVQKNMMKELKKVQDEIDKVIAIANGAYGIWNNFLNPKQTPTKTTPSPPMVAPGSMYPAQTPQSASPPSQSTASPNPQSSNQPSQPVQKFAKGGTVKGGQTSKIRSSFRGATPTAMGRKAIESTNAFETFGTVASDAKINSSILGGRDGVTDNFDKVNQSLDQFLKVLKGEDTGKPPGPPSPPGAPGGSPPGSTAPSVPGNGKISGGAVVTQRNDRDGEQTGIDIALRDSSGGFGIGALIRNPFESLKITGVGFQGSGSGESGKGFGLYVTGEAVVDGKRYELLVGHLDKAHVKQGDVLSGGDSIGAQGISGRATGPHVSTHINALDGGNAQLILNAVEKSWVNGTLIKSQNLKPGKSNISPVSNNKASKISQSPEDSLLAMGGVDFFVTQVIEKPVPFPQLIRVNSSGESTNNSVPEINPLLLV